MCSVLAASQLRADSRMLHQQWFASPRTELIAALQKGYSGTINKLSTHSLNLDSQRGMLSTKGERGRREGALRGIEDAAARRATLRGWIGDGDLLQRAGNGLVHRHGAAHGPGATKCRIAKPTTSVGEVTTEVDEL